MKICTIKKMRKELYASNIALCDKEFKNFNKGDHSAMDRIFKLDKERWYILHCSKWEVIKAYSRKEKA